MIYEEDYNYVSISVNMITKSDSRLYLYTNWQGGRIVPHCMQAMKMDYSYDLNWVTFLPYKLRNYDYYELWITMLTNIYCMYMHSLGFNLAQNEGWGGARPKGSLYIVSNLITTFWHRFMLRIWPNKWFHI